MRLVTVHEENVFNPPGAISRFDVKRHLNLHRLRSRGVRNGLGPLAIVSVRDEIKIAKYFESPSKPRC